MLRWDRSLLGKEFSRCEQHVTSYVKTHWCPSHKGHKYFLQISENKKLPQHCQSH